MTPKDIRNAVWSEMRERLSGARTVVHDLWRKHGPCTSRELAHRTHTALETIRPRTTELYQMGLLRLVRKCKHEGVYEAVDLLVAVEAESNRRANGAANEQLQLI